MSDDILRYTNLQEAIQLAQDSGMTTRQIVRILVGCVCYEEALDIARKAAPLLEISIKQFMAFRKNE